MNNPHLRSLVILITIIVSTRANIHSQEDGFTFDTPEDLSEDLVQPPRTNQFKEFGKNYHEAVVGKIFHLALSLPRDHRGFVAKQQHKMSLPYWLSFNKKTGIFWGIPLPGDEGTLHINIAPMDKNQATENLEVRVISEENEDSVTTKNKCGSNEDETILTLLLDKNLRAIKPKQRVIAMNNIAKFFRIRYSAFTLKPQLEKDDITDSSVVLAGPGNLQTRNSKLSSYLEVLVGCDGRLWDSTAPIVHNLKQQARDGTIAEVLGLPLIGWRVKTETKPILRSKRQAVDDYGSGDYDDDYYDEYDEYNDEDDLGDVESNPPTSKKTTALPTQPAIAPKSTTIASVTASTTTVATSTHPHRHHHGEIKPNEDLDSADFDVISENLPIFPEEPKQSETTTTESKVILDPGTTKVDIPKQKDTLDFDNNDYDYESYDDDDDDTEDDVESGTTVPDINKKIVKPVFGAIPDSTTTESNAPRRVDGEDNESETETTILKTSLSTSTTTEAPTTFEIVEDTEPPIFTVGVTEVTTQIVASTEEATPPSTTSTTTTTTAPITTVSTSTTTVQPPTTPAVVTVPDINPTTQATTTTASEDPTTVDTEPTSGISSTTTRHVPTTSTTEAVIEQETVPYVPEPRNTKPYIEKRLQYVSVAAGKVFRYVIPKNTFKDAEDGHNLTYQVLDSNEQPIAKNSWLQFNPVRRELYGLPLIDDVSNWIYIIRASDREGAYEQDQLTIQVQQHRLDRVVNHEFVLELRIEKPQEYSHYVDWSLKVLRTLGKIYGTNMSEITVRRINQSSEPVIFAWSNDSLPTNHCPRQEIDQLYMMLTANDRGDPSRELSQMLIPDLRIKKVLSSDLTICEPQPAPPVTPTTNFSPILRNPVDKVNATQGELLIYKVKDDTFYDPEDVDPSMLNITLLTSDLTAIPSTSWLQFDSKNREFFGIPFKTGRTEYFLLCVDTGGMSAKDSLEVVVQPASKKSYNVEFSMTIGVSHDAFTNNAIIQRKFVEKLMHLFEESTPQNFHFHPFKPKRESNFESTVVYWFNKSLPVEHCPREDIKQLENMLISDSRSISSRVHRIMGPEFTVSTIKVHHIGNCKAKPKEPPVIQVPQPTPGFTEASGENNPPQENDILITLVLPIIVISIMVFIAVVAACVLYRRKRMGKLNVEEDGRQTYGNKGIPVIFQEELEEKPEPGTKAPVILKDEKPPLAPPEYSKSGSVKLEDSEPYQPPPPFTRTQDNGRQPRPKPTPTYRKPPPYVPP
ncbi:unnamed protein product [Ceutorhynchus assimilis]|uniref:Dystroglycan 1 n=1 Tax=Ceutorhynchus assimilis TaxID=467358 RepID=A0A9N9MJQ7_9CUCU|nr:unnamed protein product [Ceutorhynchus assimilis]